ncbi:hypothetical protein VDIAB_100068 [Vibrio diabolicus]|nr:hypothetical protein VDIAB_100068 [Vibrio diabolicus]
MGLVILVIIRILTINKNLVTIYELWGENALFTQKAMLFCIVLPQFFRFMRWGY